MKIVWYAMVILASTSSRMESKPMSPRDLDFWVGDWSCISNDTVIGENKIQKIIGDKVVEENFVSYQDGFVGRSWSVFDSTLSVWKQTWVDNSGAYMIFTGAKESDSIFFIEDNPVTLAGQKHYRRMIFYSIQLNSFEWKWESSTDRIAWKTNWHILYKRK